jgi:hypothetical protein
MEQLFRDVFSSRDVTTLKCNLKTFEDELTTPTLPRVKGSWSAQIWNDHKREYLDFLKWLNDTDHDFVQMMRGFPKTMSIIAMTWTRVSPEERQNLNGMMIMARSQGTRDDRVKAIKRLWDAVAEAVKEPSAENVVALKAFVDGLE